MSTDLQALKSRMRRHGLTGMDKELANRFFIIPIDPGGCTTCKPGCQPGCVTCSSGCSQGAQNG